MAGFALQEIKGVIPALVTTFDKDGGLDLEKGRKLIEALIAKGIGGLYVTGSTGEGFLMTEDERDDYARMVVETAAGRVPVIVQIGDIGTRKSIDLARRAQEAGADAVSSVPPFYYHFSDDEIFGYYSDICSSVDIPMVVYNISLAGMMNRGLVERLGTIKNVKGLKFTGREHDDMCALKLALGKDFMVYSGCDEMAAQGLLAGADGIIGSTYNLMSEAFVRIVELAGQDKFLEAFEIQKCATSLIHTLTSHSFFPTLKRCCREIGLDAGHARRPFVELDEAEYAEVAESARKVRDRFGDCGIEYLRSLV